MRQGSNTKCPRKDDDYDTPKIAFDILFKYLKITDETIWCPFFNTGKLNETLQDYTIIHDNKDFFDYIPIKYDILIDNPPYSNKKNIMERCIEINKPFCLLLPLDTLERQYMNKLMSAGDWTVIIPNTRLKFNNNKVTMPFKAVWFCYNCNLGRQLIFD